MCVRAPDRRRPLIMSRAIRTTCSRTVAAAMFRLREASKYISTSASGTQTVTTNASGPLSSTSSTSSVQAAALVEGQAIDEGDKVVGGHGKG